MSQVATAPPYRSIYTRWWFGHLVMLGLCGAVLAMAFILQPTDAAVTLFGVEVPVTCGFRRFTGYNCPGCGMTRSFTFLAHGQVMEAFRMNVVGPFLFAAMATQPPYRVYALIRGWYKRSRRAVARQGAARG